MNRPIRTYIAAFKSGISTLMEYRIDFLTNSTLSLLIHALVQILLWESVFKSKGQGDIQGYTADSMYMYICFVSLCTILTRSGRIERGVGDEIRNGDLNKYLLKPLSHLGFSGAMVAAEKVGTLLFALIIFPFFVFFTTYHIQIAGTIWGMLILLTAIICKFFISMAISYLAFWYEETWTFHIILDISMVFCLVLCCHYQCYLLGYYQFQISSLFNILDISQEPWQAVQSQYPMHHFIYS